LWWHGLELAFLKLQLLLRLQPNYWLWQAED